MSKIILKKVYYMPAQLEPGILYVSDEFKVAAHLCPCGCGNKVNTPLGPANWKFIERNNEPTLSPSISNWQFPCKSHYWITKGDVKWSYKLSSEDALESWQFEEGKRRRYYEELETKKSKKSVVKTLINWFRRK